MSPATGRSPPTSTPRSSTCGRAPGPTRTGACPRPACPPTAMTATSSGTPRPGCSRRCWPSIRSSPARWRLTASTVCPRPSATPARPATGARASRGRARWTAPSRSRRRCRSTAKGSTSSTSPPTSRSPSGSTTWRPATAPGWRRGWPVISGAAGSGRRGRPARRRRLRHPPRHRARRGEPGRRRRGLHPGRRRTTLLDAVAAAKLLAPAAPGALVDDRGRPAGARRHGVNPEFDGYRGQLVKQADVTLLGYPWDFRSSPAVERADLATTCRAPTRADRR